MAMTVLPGPVVIELDSDEFGYRTYVVRFTVLTDGEGPFTVHEATGLPVPGGVYNFLGETDPNAYCTFERKVRRAQGWREVGNPLAYHVDVKFTTKPYDWCPDEARTDPLLLPDEISGGTIAFSEEATHDRFGEPILTSSHEQIRGPQVEFERHRATVNVKQYRADLQFSLLNSLIDGVNSVELWGQPVRCVKFDDFSWHRKFRGGEQLETGTGTGGCQVYFERVLKFSVNLIIDPFTGVTASGFDRDVLDEGTKVLRGKWDESTGAWVLVNVAPGVPPDPDNPTHFIRYKDRNDNPARVVLDGGGQPAGAQLQGTGTRLGGEAGYINIQYYSSFDLAALLGLPTDFEVP